MSSGSCAASTRAPPVTSAGTDPVESHLRVLRVHLDVGESLDEGLSHIPAAVREAVRERWQAERDVPIRRAVALSDSGGPRPWFDEWRPAEHYHWRRLRAWLLDVKGRSEAEVESVDDSSDRVLAHIEDPRPEGPDAFQVRGLVLGYVQSGKTANFSALTAKAADAGYKLVIVLSGIHNELRRQTQRRLAQELGLAPDPAGVGLPVVGERWISLTTPDLNGDFRPGTFDANVLQGNERVIAVVKKNATVLTRLVSWMAGRVPDWLPVLVIDDEADQASINTGGDRPPLEAVDLTDDDVGAVPPEDELDPSTINRLIRQLLGTSQRVSYVGYTATPFANVLTDPAAMDRDAGEGLYPRDFIISLPRPNAYVGAERIFGRRALEWEPAPVPGLTQLINLIPGGDVGALVPGTGRASDFEAVMPDSLRDAIADWILATAAKVERLGDGLSTMLVHTSHRVHIQNQVGELVRAEIRRLRQAWKYDRDSIEPVLEQRWETRFRPVVVALDAGNDRPFAALVPHLDALFQDWDGVSAVVLNSHRDNRDQVLAYEQNPTLKVVLIGGNRLSRGLTLEDLLVSYYLRDSAAYDTLLQMGRWFGYRAPYLDLTRLWTTEDLVAAFRHLALVEEDLRDDIAIYEREGLTPRLLGPRIRTHPAMLVTARNKLGSAQTVMQSYAGRLLQTSRFRLTPAYQHRDWLQANLDATRRLLARLGPPDVTAEGDPRPCWADVPWSEITGFLSEYRTSQDPESIDADTAARYIARQVEASGELVRWRVAVRSLPSFDTRLGGERLDVEGHEQLACISRTRLGKDRNSIGVLTSPARRNGRLRVGDEEVGLSDEQILEARRLVDEDDRLRLGDALRAVRPRTEGLLLVYPVSRWSRPDRADDPERIPLYDHPETEGVTVVGIALSFPRSDSAAAVEYVAGPAGRSDPP